MTMTEPVSRAQRVTADALTGQRPIVVLAPHPDDESLGCGGLLAHAFAGDGAHVVLMTDGAGSHPGSRLWTGAERAAQRARELDTAIHELGGRSSDVTRLGLPDAGMGDPAMPVLSIARTIARQLSRLGARTLFATAPTDPHCDHQATAEIARLCARLTRARLFYYPVWSRWKQPDFRTGLVGMDEYRLDTTPVRRRKARAIAAHRSQHGQVFTDDAAGFVLDPEFVRMFVDADELYFEGTLA
ncbi:LmbE family protein [Salipiger aestuarii]|uniref:LmbE family N-acetylglucosaminyl deacetylase n=1 Tax=Salipiger aestuarii TaxID=568098 RepID=A0A327XIU2_9RHOB|nr:PIG-L family deacetylase [Salipiger aestuarii]KAA8607795.1 LmbE family protein [Salipiger aestuarii]KAA8607957.1 LmbE family protein [Salipiger aestuarii]KAB2534810.1 LmbE family protein [Salipiger aestuarii]RAK09018.1 LmbE family N-acetylglucosaminyl deacetylase [Salipiger aestuarii]